MRATLSTEPPPETPVTATHRLPQRPQTAWTAPGAWGADGLTAAMLQVLEATPRG